MSCIHDYEIKGQDSDQIVERCKLCGNMVKYNKVKGSIDEAKYLKDHERDFCQPGGATNKLFRELYGNGKEVKRD